MELISADGTAARSDWSPSFFIASLEAGYRFKLAPLGFSASAFGTGV